MNTAHECENAVVYTHTLLAIHISAGTDTQTKTGCTLRDPLPPPPPHPSPIGAPTPLPWLTQKGRSLSLYGVCSLPKADSSQCGVIGDIGSSRPRSSSRFLTILSHSFWSSALKTYSRFSQTMANWRGCGGDAGYQRGLAIYACIHVCVCVCVCACVRAWCVVRACVVCVCCVRERRGGCARRRSTHLSIVKRLDRLGLAERHLGHRAGRRAILERRLVRDAVRLGEKVARLPPDDGAEERNANPTLLPSVERAGEERERGRRRLIGCRDGS